MNDDVRPTSGNADAPSDLLAAVSAILDGTATADERALVLGSTEATQLLEQLGAHRQLVVSVDVPDDVREHGIAAALAVFDELQLVADPMPVTAAAAATAGAAVRSNVVSLDRRRRLYRVVTGAAAALMVVVVGVAAINMSGGSDDESSSVAVDDGAATAASEKAGAVDAATMADAGDAAPLTEAPAETDSPVATDAPMMAEGGAPEESTAETGSTTPPTIGEIPGPAQALPSIVDQQQLATYVGDADRAADDLDHPCAPDGTESLGDVSYQGEPAVVVRDAAARQVTVYAVDDCTVLATLSL